MKTTLLIDGNWLLMSRMFTLNNYFQYDQPEETKETGSDYLVDLMARSINLTINRFRDVVTNVVLISDAGSWRKHIPVPESMGDTQYKGNRTKDSDTDWEYVFQALNRLSDNCEALGITVSHAQDIEGDDWVWYWSRTLNDQGINTVIWSSDNDLKQLVQYKNGVFTCWYNDKNGLFLPEALNNNIDDAIEFFMRPEICNTAADTLRSKAKTTEYINPDLIVMEKIICGDSGDNIKPIVSVVKSARNYGVSIKDWDKVREDLHISDLTEFYNERDKVIRSITNLGKFKGYSVNNTIITERFDYNKILVWLDGEVIPSDIKAVMEKCQYKEYNLENIYNNYKIMVEGEKDNKIEDLFEGLPF